MKDKLVAVLSVQCVFIYRLLSRVVIFPLIAIFPLLASNQVKIISASKGDCVILIYFYFFIFILSNFKDHYTKNLEKLTVSCHPEWVPANLWNHSIFSEPTHQKIL